MKVWTRLRNYTKDSSRPLILALGNFDGVHLGHQAILSGVVRRGKERRGVAAVMTFSEHPQRVLHGSTEPALLTSPQHRLFLFQGMGIEVCFLLPFTLAFSKTDPETFVRECLVELLGAREVHMGYNAHFGFQREGDSDFMRRLAQQYGFAFYEAPPVRVEGKFVSSSLIRQMIKRGELHRAQEFLGRPFSILGTVVRGKGRGTRLGFPTANLRPHSEILPPQGVYFVEVRDMGFHLHETEHGDEFEFVAEVPRQKFQGVLNLGVRPTFEVEGQEIPEVHLLNFSGELYGKTLEITFCQRLRGEKLFASEKELGQRIEQDVEEARTYFNDRGPQEIDTRVP